MITISTCYDKAPLLFVQQDDKQAQFWKKYPVRISAKEKDAMDMNLILFVMKGNHPLPSQLADISEDQIASPIISKINRAFHTAIKKYAEDLKKAEEEDQKIITSNESSYVILETECDCCIVRAIRRWTGTVYITQNRFDHEARLHRYQWMTQVVGFERQRIGALKDDLITAFKPLVRQLVEQEKSGLVDKTILLRAEQVQRMFTAFFPKESLDQAQVVDRLRAKENTSCQ